MRFLMLVAFAVSLTLAACSSSSNDTAATTDCIAGTYTVTFTKASGDCEDITQSPEWTLTRVGDQYFAPLPTGATATGGTFDSNTCKGQYSYSQDEGAGACMTTGTVAYDLAFSSTGFTGTMSLQDCEGGDSGVATKCTGTYTVTGTRH